MPRLEYFVASESIAVDVNSNAISIFHILNEVQLHEFPSYLPMLAVVSAWIFDESEIAASKECQAKVEFTLPGTTEKKVYRTNITAKERFHNIHLQLENIPIDKAGDLVVRIVLDDKEEATHTIAISGVGD